MQDVPIRVKSAPCDEKNDPQGGDPPTTRPNTQASHFHLNQPKKQGQPVVQQHYIPLLKVTSKHISAVETLHLS